MNFLLFHSNLFIYFLWFFLMISFHIYIYINFLVPPFLLMAKGQLAKMEKLQKLVVKHFMATKLTNFDGQRPGSENEVLV